MSNKRIFKSWGQLYALVIAFLVVQLVIYYFITSYYG